MKKEEGKPARKYVGQSVCQPAGQPKPEEGRKKQNKQKENKQTIKRASEQTKKSNTEAVTILNCKIVKVQRSW